MKKRWIAIFLILCMTIIQTGCSDNVAEIAGVEKPVQENKKKVVSRDISIPMLSYRTLNPIASKDEDVFYLRTLIYDSLISLNENMEPIPSLAESWSYEDNGNALVLQLRNDVTWHDGSSFTSEDVKLTIDALLRGRSGGLSVYGPYINQIKSVSTNGKYSVKINFNNNQDVAVEKLIFPIVSASQFKSAASATEVNVKYSPIGTGKYMVDTIVENKSMKLIANPNYFGAKATNTITFKVMPSKEDGINLIDVNDINVSFTKLVDREKYLENADITLSDYISNEVEVIGFNFKSPLMQDKRMRKAIAYSISSKEVIKNAYYRSGQVSENIFYPNYLGMNQTEENDIWKYDAKKALSLINSMGYVKREGSSTLTDAQDNDINLKILVNEENAARVEAAKLLKSNLDKIPVSSTVVSKDWKGYQSALSSGDYDIYIGGFSMLENMDFRSALHSKHNNPIHYENERVDELLDKLQSGISLSEKKSVFGELKTILDDELPYYCLLYKTGAAVSTKSMTNTVVPYFYDLYHGAENWQYIY